MLAQLSDVAMTRNRLSLVASMAEGDWRAKAISAYRSTENEDITAMSAELASRITALTGRHVRDESIHVDRTVGMATVVIDNMLFQLRRGELVVLRPCVHCGIGEFVSPAIESLADLGHALDGWEPRCMHCPAEDPADW